MLPPLKREKRDTPPPKKNLIIKILSQDREETDKKQLKIGTLNLRSTKKTGSFSELEEALIKSKI